MKRVEMRNGDVVDAECDHSWEPYYEAGDAEPTKYVCKKCPAEREEL